MLSSTTDSIPAGCELDVAIAQRMGWTELHAYSTEIAPAFYVVEKMTELGYAVWIEWLTDFQWEVTFHYNDNGGLGHSRTSVALAICRAALAALGAETP